ncbi:MAG: stage 0 sporulation family protein [Clostridia bacterium]|nr:stage 0 sporulation family protein [Clostridia bacterium]
MVKVIGVRFKNTGKMYYFNPNGFEIKNGMNVIVETARGVEFGEAVSDIKEIDEEEAILPLKDVIRIATEEDVQTHNSNIEKEKMAFDICNEKIAKHELQMKLIDVEYTFDGNKILFYFVADTRIDFRELVKDLAAVFKTRIELRQVGVRDQAKAVGGLGICGRVICCASATGEFQPVSIKMAKEQSLSLSPTKISGTCGRLMCCLKYEQEAYEDAIHRLPGVGSVVETPEGQGVITEVNLLRETVKIRLDRETETDLVVYPVDEIKVLHKKHFSPTAKHEDGEVYEEKD